MKKLILFFVIICCVACGSDPVPKPKAFLRLDYPKQNYQRVQTTLPFSFEKNDFAENINGVKTSRDKKSSGVDINYPSLKGTIYLTYKEIENGDLTPYLRDAQNMTQKHSQRADEIIEQPYINSENNVYGMFYEVGGNAASQSQFYVTDSIRHFITGSLYFYAKPNYDSILPAAHYLKEDIKHLMETIKWDN